MRNTMLEYPGTVEIPTKIKLARFMLYIAAEKT